MKKTRMKIISKIMVFVMVLSIVVMPGTVGAASRLTSAKDTLSTIKASGAGAATTGYTQSTQSITDDFVFTTANDVVCMNTAGVTASSTCAGANDVKVHLIANGGLTSGAHYTGDQVAAAIATGLAAQDGDADDSYTVTYAETSDLFSIRADGGNTLNPALGWAAYTGSDSASSTLGYTANDSAIRDAAATSDNAVAFNVLNNVNDAFSISVNSEIAVAVDMTANSIATTTTGIVSLMDAAIDAASTDNVTVSYASDKFKITSDLTGANSSIVVTEGTNDFLRSVRLVGDVPVDGTESGNIVSANHTILFTLPIAVDATDKIIVTFPDGFVLPTNLNFEDVDFQAGGSEITLVDSSPGATEWGATTSGQTLILTSGTSAGVSAGATSSIEIGYNATYSTTGTEQISNPTTAGLYEITIEQTASDGTTIEQDATIAVYIVSDDSVVIQATVDPILSFAIQGGNVLDFGTLEPNAYHKLGGARTGYGTITLTSVAIDAVLDTNTVTVRGIVYEFTDDGVASGSNVPVMIVDNENNYLTTAQVTANLYRAINNTDGDLVRANIDYTTNTVVHVVGTASGVQAGSYAITEAVTDADFAVTDFAGDNNGYNNKSTSVDYAGGSDVGNGQIGNNLVISTNSAGGYAITVQNTDDGTEASGLTNGTSNIDSWGAGTYGYGILASAQSARYGNGTAGIIENLYEGDGAGDLPEAMSTTATRLAFYEDTAANDNIAVEYNIRISASQAAGQYTDTVTYIATATY